MSDLRIIWQSVFGNYDEVIQKVMDKRLAENITEFKVSKQSPAIRVFCIGAATPSQNQIIW